jgi:TolB-like protein/DNA-binding winged helix-turn-helix (wHTH) protein/Tfp pilus assembly protein PilF
VAAVHFIFGDRVLDVERRELRRGGELVSIGPQVLDLLIYLLQNRERVVSKDDLIASVWGGRIVSESTLTSRINAVRSAIGDTGAEQQFIKTLPRKGFRFVGAVREGGGRAEAASGHDLRFVRQDQAGLSSDLSPAADEFAQQLSSTPFAISQRPSVVVLPFANLSGDPEQDYFADGLTEDITTALSLWHSFPVIARGSAFAYKGQSPDLRKVGKDLGARYVVEGSVRKSGNRVRITAQLIDTESGHQVWAGRYDRELTDIFALQDEITERIAAIVEPAIASSERNRLSTRPPKDLNAWDLCIQGYSLIYQGTKKGNEQARELFERAIALDPNYARAWTGLAYTYSRDFRLWRADARETTAKKTLECARQAVRLDDADSEAHLMLGRGFYQMDQPENAIAELRRAIELNPQNSTANWTVGHVLYCNGRAKEAIPWIEKALDINPLDPRNYVVTTHLAVARLCVGDYETAVELARASIRQRPDYIDSRITLAAALGHLHRADEAREALGEFRDLVREYIENHPYPMWRIHVKDHVLTGLRTLRLVD